MVMYANEIEAKEGKIKLTWDKKKINYNIHPFSHLHV